MVKAVGADTFELVDVLPWQVVALVHLSFHLLEFAGQAFSQDLELLDSELLAYFEHTDQVCGVALDRLDAHVVVHAFLHECGLAELLLVIRNVLHVQALQVRQVEKHIRRVVAQMADGVVAVVLIVEVAGLEQRQPVQVKHFLERADFVAREVQVLQILNCVEIDTDGLDVVAG